MRTDDVASAHLWKAGWSLVMTAALVACGGGGGGGPKNDDDDVGTTPDPPGLSYTGITTAATLSANTTPHITGALLFELGLATAQRPLPASFAAHRAPGAITFLGKARHRISKQTTPRMESISNEPCAQGGTVQIDDRTDNRGIGTVILTYNACVEDGARTDGTLSLRVDAFDLVNNVPTDFTGTFQNFSITEGTFITDIAGTAHTVATSTSITDTYNTVTRYRPEGVMHRYQNMVVRTTAHPQSFSDDVVNVTGRFFHSAHGYVDVETRVPLRVNVNSGSLSDGTLRLRGAGVVTADVGFEQFGNVALSLDENGDSVVDRALRVARSALLSTTNFPPFAHAGPDATVPEGHTLTLDGSGSADWEGNPLTYQWVVQSGPSGSGTVIGTQQRVDFRPMTPGTYVIQLNVADSQPNSGFDTMTLTVLDNLAPVARAGLDVPTVERATVTLDGSNSTDPEGDPLTYQWTLTSGPSGNNAPQTSTGATLSFMPDRTGTYVYRLRASDPFGFSEDVVTISADHLVSVGPLNISVDSRTTSAEATRTLQVTVSSRYSGPPVALAASTNVTGLRVVSISGQTGPSATVVVSADTTALQSIDNGLYEGLLTVTPAGGYTPSHSFASLALALPRVTQITPYVAYPGETPAVTLYGEQLHQTFDGTLIIDDTEVQGFSETLVDQTRITLPALPEGEYSIRIRNNLGIVQPMSRYVVRPAPTYDDSELDIAGRVESLEYDAERDVFYVVSWDLDYGHTNEVYRLRYDGSTWHRDTIAAAAPQAVSLTADGATLLVTGDGCNVMEFDPATLALLRTVTRPSCFGGEYLGLVYGLADGRVLVGDTNQWPTVWNYPEFVQRTIPSLHSPVHALNYNRNRMIWAQAPTISPMPAESLYVYNAVIGTSQVIPVHDPELYFLPGLVAISGEGDHIMHRSDVYQAGVYSGSLQGVSHPYLSPALTRHGDRALVLEPDTHTLSLFDLTSGPDFPLIGDVAVLPDDVGYANRMMILPDDRVAFVFTMLSSVSGVNTFKLYVRNLP